MAEETPSTGAADAQSAQQFNLQRIYIKDVSFETPAGVEAFKQQWAPKVNLDLNTRNAKLEDDLFEVVLSLTITAKNGSNEDTVFLAEVQQGGIFHMTGFEPQALHQLLGTVCPNILFPYAREAVDNLVTKGSFPALMLAPVNFDALYQQAMQQAAAEAKAKQEQGEASPAAH